MAEAPLTLVDAPVGFGKTLLVESWCARHDGAVAWVSLETGDNDPSRRVFSLERIADLGLRLVSVAGENGENGAGDRAG